MNNLQQQDPEIFDLLQKEQRRQREGLEMIPSESYASLAVLEAVGSVFNNKYAENYPGKRYYGGCQYVDQLERLCQKRALMAFGLSADEYHVNVQPYSGSPANLEVYYALLKLGDKIMAPRLDQGGHLTHGSPVNFSGREYEIIPYGVDEKSEQLDYDEIEKLAKKHKPKLILSGFTAYPRRVDFQRFSEIAKNIGAISMADTSHITGLIIAGQHPSPFPFTDVVTTTTHKTLRGARGAMIFCKKELAKDIDRAVFPGMQGGPHEHSIAGIAVALAEAGKPEFKEYAKQTIKNTHALAESLQTEGIRLVSGGSDNHLILLDLRSYGSGKGMYIEKALEAVDISVNKTTVPYDPAPPFYPSGIRLGTPAVTSRGMKEGEMKRAGQLIVRVVKAFAPIDFPEEKTERREAVKKFKETLKDSPVIEEVRREVNELASKFPVPGIDD